MMTLIAILFFLMFCGTSWILVIVVRRNEELRDEKALWKNDALTLKGLSRYLTAELHERDHKIRDMETGMVLLHEDHMKSRDMDHRVIAKLLEKQMQPAKTEEEAETTSKPLKLVRGG